MKKRKRLTKQQADMRATEVMALVLLERCSDLSGLSLQEEADLARDRTIEVGPGYRGRASSPPLGSAS
jgi:hypothetical protein